MVVATWEEQPGGLQVFEFWEALKQEVVLVGSVPTGAPKTMSPCSCRGVATLPTQTSGPNTWMLGGGWPVWFQTPILPALSWTCAWW